MDLQLELKRIGLTENESKIYLSLSKIGKSTTGLIIKETNIHASKVYEGLQRLIKKGLVSFVIKNNVKYFQSVEPERLIDLIELKEKELQIQKKLIQTTILPAIKKSSSEEEINIEVFQGWKGMESVYSRMRRILKRGDTNFVFGAGKGENSEKTKIFFNIHLKLLAKKKIKQKIIYNEEARENIEEQEKHKSLFEVRYLSNSTPTEVNIWKDHTMVVLLRKEPYVILIKDKETSKSFLEYFNSLWKIAKK